MFTKCVNYLKILNNDICSLLIALVIGLVSIQGLTAQTPADGIAMDKGELCLAFIGEKQMFDKYWEGKSLRSNATIATVHRNEISPLIAIGLSKKLNIFLALPFVQTYSTVPNGGKFAGTAGFQDIMIALKANFFNVYSDKAELNFFVSAGYTTPATNYLSDYRPYSIGNGTDEANIRLVFRYKHLTGFYVRSSFSFIARGYTKAERNYYYNNGSYFTHWMDVPNAWNAQFVSGVWLLKDQLRLELFYNGMISTNGDDIRSYNAPQPTNKVNFDQLGGLGQYYFDSIKGLGIIIGYSYNFNGRNIGQINTFRAGLTYQFNI